MQHFSIYLRLSNNATVEQFAKEKKNWGRRSWRFFLPLFSCQDTVGASSNLGDGGIRCCPWRGNRAGPGSHLSHHPSQEQDSWEHRGSPSHRAPPWAWEQAEARPWAHVWILLSRAHLSGAHGHAGPVWSWRSALLKALGD